MQSIIHARIDAFVMHLDRIVDGAQYLDERLFDKLEELADWHNHAPDLVDPDPNSQERQDYELVATEEAERWGTVVPSILRASLFMSCYSALEHFLTSVCDHASSQPHSLRVSDLRGDGIARAYTYLRKVVALDLQKAERHWNTLNDYRLIRNALTHNGGRVPPEKRKAFLTFPKRISGISLSETDDVLLEEAFLQGFVETSSAFATAIGAAFDTS